MKTKTFICFLLSSIYTFAQKTANYELLWEISGNQLKVPSYVFGSMHSNDPRLFQFPDSLYIAFENAEAIVLETDVAALFDEYDVRLDVFNFDVFGQQQPFTNSRKATKTAYGTEDGRPQFLDAYFQQTGYCAGKRFFPLESLQEQLDATEKISQLSARTVVNTFLFSKEKFVASYLAGDIATLSNMLQSQFAGMPGAYDALITDRNKIMVTGLDSLMRKQAVFSAVGSGHLYGTEGILQLLRVKGFTVRPIQATYSSTPISAKAKMTQWKSFPLKNESFNFSITLSGKPMEFISEEYYRMVYQELGQGNTFELVVRKSNETLDECTSEFIDNTTSRPKEVMLPSGLKAIEGQTLDLSRGLQWKRIIVTPNWTYVITCFGGNKFMHSNRPQQFFDRLEIRQ